MDVSALGKGVTRCGNQGFTEAKGCMMTSANGRGATPSKVPQNSNVSIPTNHDTAQLGLRLP